MELKNRAESAMAKTAGLLYSPVVCSGDEVRTVVVAIDGEHPPTVRRIDDAPGARRLGGGHDLLHRQAEPVLEGDLRDEHVLLRPRRQRLRELHPEQIYELVHAQVEVRRDVDDGRQVDAISVAHG